MFPRPSLLTQGSSMYCSRVQCLVPGSPVFGPHSVWSPQRLVLRGPQCLVPGSPAFGPQGSSVLGLRVPSVWTQGPQCLVLRVPSICPQGPQCLVPKALSVWSPGSPVFGPQGSPIFGFGGIDLMTAFSISRSGLQPLGCGGVSPSKWS